MGDYWDSGDRCDQYFLTSIPLVSLGLIHVFYMNPLGCCSFGWSIILLKRLSHWICCYCNWVLHRLGGVSVIHEEPQFIKALFLLHVLHANVLLTRSFCIFLHTAHYNDSRHSVNHLPQFVFICSWRQVNVGLLWIFHLPKELDGLFIQRWTNWPIDLFCIYWKWHFNWPCGKDKFLLGLHWIEPVSTCYSWERHHIEGGSTAFNKSGGFCTAMNTNWITVVFGGGTKVIVTGKFWFMFTDWQL